jgi:hypothetical protein
MQEPRECFDLSVGTSRMMYGSSSLNPASASPHRNIGAEETWMIINPDALNYPLYHRLQNGYLRSSPSFLGPAAAVAVRRFGGATHAVRAIRPP